MRIYKRRNLGMQETSRLSVRGSDRAQVAPLPEPLLRVAPGCAGLALIPGIASAAPPAHANAGGKYGSSAPPEHAQDQTGFGAGGRFGPGGAPRNYCGGTYICNSNSYCAGGCTCSCVQNIKNFPTDICC